MDRQICPEAHILASRGSPSDANCDPRDRVVYPYLTRIDGFFFLARRNAAKLDFLYYLPRKMLQSRRPPF